MFAWNFFADRHASEYLQSPRSQKNGGKKVFPTETPGWPFLAFWWLAVGGNNFSPLAPVLDLEKRMALFYCSWGKMWYQILQSMQHSNRWCKRYLWGREFPSARINQETETREIGTTFPCGPSNWKIDYTRNTSRDVSPSSRSSAVSPLGPMLEGGAVVVTYW